MRAGHATGAGNIRQGLAQAPVQGPEPVRSSESFQPRRKAYPSVSQERRHLTEVRKSPFIPHNRRSSACHSRYTAHISVACSFHSAGDRRLEQLDTITQPNRIRDSATESEWRPKRQQHNRIVRVSIKLLLTAISVGGWSSSTQAESHPLANTD